MMSEVSIITVNKNNGIGLSRTIASVLLQELITFEHIIIDGNSIDNSTEIIARYSIKVEKKKSISLTWISEDDNGIYEAMNKGIRLAKGKYLLFLNSGDYLVDSQVLKKVFSEPRSADLLLGNCNISKNGLVIHRTQPPQSITFGYLYHSGLSHQSTFIKRELFKKFGFYREDFRYNSDIDFWYETIIINCCSTLTLGITIADYNTDGISSLENRTEKYLNEISEIYSRPMLQLFVPDYENWKEEKKSMSILYWVKSKKILYGFLVQIYKLAKLLNK